MGCKHQIMTNASPVSPRVIYGAACYPICIASQARLLAFTSM